MYTRICIYRVKNVCFFSENVIVVFLHYLRRFFFFFQMNYDASASRTTTATADKTLKLRALFAITFYSMNTLLRTPTILCTTYHYEEYVEKSRRIK